MSKNDKNRNADQISRSYDSWKNEEKGPKLEREKLSTRGNNSNYSNRSRFENDNDFHADLKNK